MYESLLIFACILYVICFYVISNSRKNEYSLSHNNTRYPSRTQMTPVLRVIPCKNILSLVALAHLYIINSTEIDHFFIKAEKYCICNSNTYIQRTIFGLVMWSADQTGQSRLPWHTFIRIRNLSAFSQAIWYILHIFPNILTSIFKFNQLDRNIYNSAWKCVKR